MLAGSLASSKAIDRIAAITLILSVTEPQLSALPATACYEPDEFEAPF
jgi:hypothetical protein